MAIFLGLILTIGGIDTTIQQEERRGEHHYFLDQQRVSELIDVPGMPDFKRGIDLVAAGKAAEAAAVFEEVVRRYPRVSKGYYNLGVVYKFLGKYMLAKKTLRKAWRLREDPRYKEQLKEMRNLLLQTRRSTN